MQKTNLKVNNSTFECFSEKVKLKEFEAYFEELERKVFHEVFGWGQPLFLMNTGCPLSSSTKSFGQNYYIYM